MLKKTLILATAMTLNSLGPNLLFANTDNSKGPAMLALEQLILHHEDPSQNAQSSTIINAQLYPVLSEHITKGESCELPMNEKDKNQQLMDQLTVRSIYELYKDVTNKNISETNLHLVVLMQKINLIEDLNTKASDYLKELSQDELLVSQFIDQNEHIQHFNNLIKAHQSLETGKYNIDKFIRIAINEYIDCKRPELAQPLVYDPNRPIPIGGRKFCRKNMNNSLWSNWFSFQGIGLYDPQISSAVGKSTGGDDLKPEPRKDTIATLFESMIGNNSQALIPLDSQSVENMLDVSTPSSAYHSRDLTKKLFSLINIYGGEKFNYFEYMEVNKLSPDWSWKGDGLNAPGKVVAGLLLKLANQRLISVYKYQRCTLLKNNTRTVAGLKTAFEDLATDKDTDLNVPSSRPGEQSVIPCPNGACPSGSTQVTSGPNTLAVTGNSGKPTADPASDFKVSSSPEREATIKAFINNLIANGGSSPENISKLKQAAETNGVSPSEIDQAMGWPSGTTKKAFDGLNTSSETNNSSNGTVSTSGTGSLEYYCGNGQRKDRTGFTRQQAIDLCSKCDASSGSGYALCVWNGQVIRQDGNVPATYLERALLSTAPAISTPSAPASSGQVASGSNAKVNPTSSAKESETTSSAQKTPATAAGTTATGTTATAATTTTAATAKEGKPLYMETRYRVGGWEGRNAQGLFLTKQDAENHCKKIFSQLKVVSHRCHYNGEVIFDFEDKSIANLVIHQYIRNLDNKRTTISRKSDGDRYYTKEEAIVICKEMDKGRDFRLDCLWNWELVYEGGTNPRVAKFQIEYFNGNSFKTPEFGSHTSRAEAKRWCEDHDKRYSPDRIACRWDGKVFFERGTAPEIGSPGFRAAIKQGGIGIDQFYENIANFLRFNKTEADEIKAMADFNASAEDIQTAKARYGMLSVVSPGLKHATQPGGIGSDKYYENIANFLKTNPTQEAMEIEKKKWGVSDADVYMAKLRHGLLAGGGFHKN